MPKNSQAPPTPNCILDSLSPMGLLLVAIVSIQIGAGMATQLFPILGAEGTVAIRIIISASLLGMMARKSIHTFGRLFIRNWRILLSFGLCIVAMNLFFYLSIARIPLGAAVAIEFAGPLGVAAFTSRRFIHFVWVGLAAFGIILLSPFTGINLDTWGIIFALMAGAGWAAFTVIARRVGDKLPGNDGLTIGMIIAAIVMIPLAVPVASELFSESWILLAAFGVALLSTTLPFTLEFSALKRIPPRNYGVLVSAEPAVAALVGAVLLGERIGIQGMTAVACVVIAAIGISVSDRQNAKES